MRRVAVGAMVVLASLVATPGTSWAAKPAWKLVTTPTVSGSGAQLSSVSCGSQSACVAVGDFKDAAGNDHALAESWNGRAWVMQPVPEPPGAVGSWLYGVSCPAANPCIAVGYSSTTTANSTTTVDSTLAESWDGTAWKILTTPNPSSASFFNSVSCVSASACVAVGGYQSSTTNPSTLAESWDGKTWTLESPQDGHGFANFLDGVSCVSPSLCTGVGYSGGATGLSSLAELRVALTWTTEDSPSPNQDSSLNSVSCPTATSCTAVGGLIESWNGAQWSVQPTAVSGKLWGVTCASASSCTAVGSADTSGGSTLAEVWNGSSWTVQPTPNPSGTNPTLAGVSCPSGSCMAVGSYLDSSGIYQTLAELRS